MSQNAEPQKEDVKALSLKEVITGIETLETQFKESEHSKSPSLLYYFEQRQKKTITQVICLGLGNFTRIGDESKTEKGFNRPLQQLAMLRILLEGLTEESKFPGKPKIPIYFQDPNFTDSEISYLHSLGYEVLKDPEAAHKMTTRTFLYAPCVSPVLITHTINHKIPAIYIGNDLENAIEQVRTDGHDNAITGQYGHVHPLELFERATHATQTLPILGKDALGLVKYTTVYWLDANYEQEDVVADVVGGVESFLSG